MELFLVIVGVILLLLLAAVMDASRRRRRARRLPTERQMEFIETLRKERDCGGLGVGRPATRREASELIDQLLRCPKHDWAKDEVDLLIEIRDLLRELHGRVFDKPGQTT